MLVVSPTDDSDNALPLLNEQTDGSVKEEKQDRKQVAEKYWGGV